MKNYLYVMMGCPASGKSTFAKENFPNAKYVSRDNIRFSKVSENEEYFSKERQVFNEFCKEINEGLQAGVDVIADATHLNIKSRKKLFSSLVIDKEKTLVAVYFIQVSLETCLEQNKNRKGTRTFVPEKVIENMYYSIQKPSFTEYNGIIDEIHTINNIRKEKIC